MSRSFLLGPRSVSLTRRNAAELAAESLTARIFAGELKPGSPLREEALAESLGVSRNTLREALRVLVHNGLVSYHMHRGATVATLTDADISDIFLVRRMLEPAAVRATPTCSRPWLAEMDTVLQRFSRAVEDREQSKVVEYDMLFHRTLVECLGSPRLTRFFESALIELRLALALFYLDTENPADVGTEHRHIRDLLNRQEIDECEALVRAHLAESEARVRGAIASQS